MPGKIIPITSASQFETLLSSSTYTIVDFYADWCGPCRAMAPQVEAAARRHAGRALVAKLDTDRSQGTAARFGIRSIPALVAFRGGRESGRAVGVVPAARLDALLTD